MKTRQQEVTTFVAVGILATAVHYLVSLVLNEYWSVLLANPGAFIVAFFVSYIGHSHFTFRLPTAERKHARRLPRFLVSALAGLAISQAMLFILTRGTGLPDWAALAVAIGITPVFTYFASRLWVFSAIAR